MSTKGLNLIKKLSTEELQVLEKLEMAIIKQDLTLLPGIRNQILKIRERDVVEDQKVLSLVQEAIDKKQVRRKQEDKDWTKRRKEERQGRDWNKRNSE